MQPNQLLEFLQYRRSFSLKEVRPDPIDPSAIELMLEAANWAPSHGQTEPWRFTVFVGEGRQRLADAFGEAYRQLTPPEKFDARAQQGQIDRAWQASAWISLGMVTDGKMPEWEEMSAVAIAAHNMHLMASSLGLACKWTSGAVALHPHVAEVLGLTPPARLLGFLYVGWPANGFPTGKRRPIGEKITWVTNGDASG
jgi:nitroreductase